MVSHLEEKEKQKLDIISALIGRNENWNPFSGALIDSKKRKVTRSLC